MNPTNLDAFTKEVQQLVIAPMTLSLRYITSTCCFRKE